MSVNFECIQLGYRYEKDYEQNMSIIFEVKITNFLFAQNELCLLKDAHKKFCINSKHYGLTNGANSTCEILQGICDDSLV